MDVAQNILVVCGIVLLASLAGYLGKKKGFGFWGPFFFSFILSPVVSLIVVLCLKKQSIDGKQASDNRESETVALDPAKKFVCTKCGTYRSGWYQICPSCGAEGAMKANK